MEYEDLKYLVVGHFEILKKYLLVSGINDKFNA